MNTTEPRRRAADKSRTRTSGVVVWKPDIILARTLAPTAAAGIVIAEPGMRPDAITAQVEAGRSVLARLAGTQAALDAHACAVQVQVREAGSERERVAAVMETYRIKTALDDAFRNTLRDVGALIEERGRR